MGNERDLKVKVNLMTQATKQRLLGEMAKITEDLQQSMFSIGEGGGTSDWHDNFAFEQAHRDAEFQSTRLKMLKKRLVDVEIIEPRTTTEDIGIGNSVIIQFSDSDEPEAITILGEADSGKKEGWISYLSPLGGLLLGKKKDDSVSLQVGDSKFIVKVIEILPGNFE